MFVVIYQKVYHDNRGWISDIRLVDADTGEIVKRLKTRYMRTTPQEAAHRGHREAMKEANKMRASHIAYLTNLDRVEKYLEQQA